MPGDGQKQAPGAGLSEQHAQWIDAALDAHKFSTARLISLFEDQRPEAVPQRAAVLAALDAHPRARRATFLGITGTPGAGKSTLTGQLARRMHETRSDLRFAVLAVDPSSRFSGGALLGDRTRVRFATGDTRLFFRSQASDTELGGLSPRSFQVCRLLYRLFDCVLIETVGIGQSEVDIRFLADRVYLVVQPMGGDEIQFLKAGIMEVPDEIVLNKCDAVDAARRSYQALKSSMALARPFDGDHIAIHRVSATEGMGLDRLAGVLLQATDAYRADSLRGKEEHYFAKWVKEEFGRRGSLYLREHHEGAREYLDAHGSFDAAEVAFEREYGAGRRG
ncbi:MAG: GTP-binding protein [Polyangiales bacterium]|nr:hypothetical protein [Myxococcales bacterium]MCB9657228.1 protein kinase [Sandaracinaceae bacterium]